MAELNYSPRYLFWVIVGIVLVVCFVVGKVITAGVWNSGIAFSLTLPLGVIYFINAALISGLIFWATAKPQTALGLIGAGLIVGGGSANLIDRLIHSGKVWDYIPFGRAGYFNLADVCVAVGLVILGYYWWHESKT